MVFAEESARGFGCGLRLLAVFVFLHQAITLADSAQLDRCQALDLLTHNRVSSPVAVEPDKPTKTQRTSGLGGELTAYLDAKVTVPDDPKAIDIIADYFSNASERTRAELLELLGTSAKRGEPIPLAKLMPKYVGESLGTTCNGPNCFNAVLNFDRSRRGDATKNETSSDRDLVQRIDGKYVLVEAREPMKPGDLILLWHRSLGKQDSPDNSWQRNLSSEIAKPWTEREVFLDHAAVYVGAGLFFHKGAKGEGFPWVFVDLKNLKADYEGALTTVHRRRPD